ncbi:hypothetical protein TCA2_5453 [Paenibacillus sp. TCA20]|uniref:GNAT family N-acetyltransferase n=1 Tax=Paenibacillus TaxID=44249 RepID=UPI0004D60F1E|nr:N-acetyltransferase [Paenibacillus sp. TCA20]GAK42959.1 hypothetical protein TCA2_5453 [Paenibacillus sp. TCA20]
MESINIVRLTELTEQQLQQAADVYVNSYYNELTSMTKDKMMLRKIIKESFVADQFYAAIIDGQVVGIMAYSTSITRSQYFDKEFLKSILGNVQGSVVHYFLAKQFHIPAPIYREECFLEAVATDPMYRGRGIATSMLLHLMHHLPYRVFKLEVVDTNHAARSIYEKHGFHIYKAVKQRWFRNRLGFNEKFYMVRTVDEPTI